VEQRVDLSNPQYTKLPSGSSGQDVLMQFALDVNLSLSRNADTLWLRLNPDLWKHTHNPWAVLQTVSGENLKRITAAPAFRATLDEIVRERRRESIASLVRAAPPSFAPTSVAYFCMEYTLEGTHRTRYEASSSIPPAILGMTSMNSVCALNPAVTPNNPSPDRRSWSRLMRGLAGW
jgi:hypothetical protein